MVNKETFILEISKLYSELHQANDSISIMMIIDDINALYDKHTDELLEAKQAQLINANNVIQDILDLTDGANLSSDTQIKEAIKGTIELADNYLTNARNS